MTDQVEHGAFGGQQAAGGGLEHQQRVTGFERRAVLHPVEDAVLPRTHDLVEDEQRDVDACGDP